MTSFIPLAYVLCTAGYSCKYTELQGQPTPALPPIHCCVHCTTHTLLRELHHPYIAACITLPLTLLHVLHCCPYIAACIIPPLTLLHVLTPPLTLLHVLHCPLHCCMYYTAHTVLHALHRPLHCCMYYTAPYIAASITLPLTLLHVLHCCPYIAACIILPSIHCHCHPYIAAYMYITLSSIHCCMYWQLIYGTQAITKQLPRVMNMCLLKQKHKTINHVIQHDQCSVQSTCTKTVPNWQSSAQFEQNIIIS